MTSANGHTVFSISEKVATYSPSNPFIALEFYPPKTMTGVEKLKERMKRMQKLKPLYVDFTWGAGGTTSDLTMDLCVQAQEAFGYVSNMHLTCTNMPRAKIDTALNMSRDKQIRNILALRGDPPVGQKDWKPVDSGFACALDLILYIKGFEKEHDMEQFFNITVAGYPEGHPTKITTFATLEKEDDPVDLDVYGLSETEKARVVQVGRDLMVCKDDAFAEEMEYLRKKVDAGATMIVTQLFYDANVFLAFMDACKKVGITVPVVPGIMCITNYQGFKRMSDLCRTRVPRDVELLVESAKDDPEKMKDVGVEIGIKLCRKLLQSGVTGLHFYTLNLDDVVVKILEGLDLFDGDY